MDVKVILLIMAMELNTGDVYILGNRAEHVLEVGQNLEDVLKKLFSDNVGLHPNWALFSLLYNDFINNEFNAYYHVQIGLTDPIKLTNSWIQANCGHELVYPQEILNKAVQKTW